MKKIFCLLLAAACVLSLTSCGFNYEKEDITKYVEIADPSSVTYETVLANYIAERKEIAESYSQFSLANGYEFDFKVVATYTMGDATVEYTPWSHNSDDDYVKGYVIGGNKEYSLFDSALMLDTEAAEETANSYRTIICDTAFSFTMQIPETYSGTSVAGKTVTFEITPVAVYPVLYEDSTIMPSVLEVIEPLVEAYAEGTPVSEGDLAVIDFVGEAEGKYFEGSQNSDYPLWLGNGGFVEGFEEQIVGHTVGETFRFDIEFPEDYGSEEIAGKTATFEVRINKAYPFGDEIVKEKTEFETVDALKTAIRVQYHAMFCALELISDASSVISYPSSLYKPYYKQILAQATRDLNYYYEAYYYDSGYTLKETEAFAFGDEGIEGYAKEEAQAMVKKDLVATYILSLAGKTFDEEAYTDYLNYLLSAINTSYDGDYTLEEIVEAYGEDTIYVNGKAKYANEFAYGLLDALPLSVSFVDM